MKKIFYRLSQVIVLLILICTSCRSGKHDVAKSENFTNLGSKLDYTGYYIKMYKADSLFQINDFKGSYQILDSLFKVYPPKATPEFAEYGIYLTAAVMSGNLENIKEKVKFGYRHFGGIATLHKDYFVDKINSAANLSDAEIDSLKREYYRSLNLELRSMMLKMLDDDQKARNTDNIALGDSLDLSNGVILKDIFKTYGYPSPDIVGNSAALDLPGGEIRVVFLLMHQPEIFKTEYLPFLLENVRTGKCDPMTYAQVYDKMVLRKNGKQYFGSFNCNSTGDICPLMNPTKIDSVRCSIGLPHIKYLPWRLSQAYQDEK